MLTMNKCDICDNKEFCKYRLETLNFYEKITSKKEDIVNSELVPSHLDVGIKCKYYRWGA